MASSSSSMVHEEEDSLMESYYPVTSVFAFTGVKAFTRCCEDRADGFLGGGSWDCNAYILFRGVSVEEMVKIERVHRSLPKMCCHYDARERVLVVKLMGGIVHQVLLRSFSRIFTRKLIDQGLDNHIVFTGSATFGDGRRQKGADESFKPIAIRPNIDAWPSLTFEVGFSESLLQLRNDARFWLTRSKLQTKIVIVIHIHKVQRQIQIERWEVINVRLDPPTITCVQEILLKKGDVYTGPPLQLPVYKVFDIVPPNLTAGDLDFTAADIQAWHALFWSYFP